MYAPATARPLLACLSSNSPLRRRASALLAAAAVTPAELAVPFSSAMEAESFERTNGRHVVLVATGDHRAHTRLSARPINDRARCLRRISETTSFGNHAVTDFDQSIGSRRSNEANVADYRCRVPLDDHPYSEPLLIRACRGLRR